MINKIISEIEDMHFERAEKNSGTGKFSGIRKLCAGKYRVN
jgi:hypothetical protein